MKKGVFIETPEKHELELLDAEKRKKEADKKTTSVEKRVFKENVEVGSSGDESDLILESDRVLRYLFPPQRGEYESQIPFRKGRTIVIPDLTRLNLLMAHDPGIIGSG
ncbi:hypothetical protein WA026_006448 [Henosepilachna vigintioctopunctata]|uniref:Uncharacterized protein n=1 Tax=Henosepilachna vigintioctopunctata TaxID=420089 RepID=A0AAW1UI20_9CUCU